MIITLNLKLQIRIWVTQVKTILMQLYDLCMKSIIFDFLFMFLFLFLAGLVASSYSLCQFCTLHYISLIFENILYIIFFYSWMWLIVYIFRFHFSYTPHFLWQYFLEATVSKEPVPPQLELIAKDILVPLLTLFHQIVQQVIVFYTSLSSFSPPACSSMRLYNDGFYDVSNRHWVLMVQQMWKRKIYFWLSANACISL